MIKRILSTCVASLLTAGMAAAEVSGTYRADTNNGPLVIDLQHEQDHYRGTVHFANQEFPIVAGEFGNRVNGVWEYQGRPVPFMGQIEGGNLTIKTNGVTYELHKVDGAPGDLAAPNPLVQPPANDPLASPAAQPEPQVVQPAAPAEGLGPQGAAPAPQGAARAPQEGQPQMQQGRYFRWAQPAGWKSEETTNGVDICAPDGLTGATHCVLRGMGQMSPDQLVKMAFGPRNPNVSNVQFIASRPMPCPMQGGQGAEYELEYNVAAGRVHAKVSCMVACNAAGFVAELMGYQSTPETFAQNGQLLTSLAQSVVIINPQQVCGNDQLVRPQPPQGCTINQPLDDSVIKHWEARNKVSDENFRKFDQTIRGVRDYTSPNSDHPIEAPNDYNHVWVSNGGQVMGSNSGQFNPNGPNGPGGTWEEATPR